MVGIYLIPNRWSRQYSHSDAIVKSPEYNNRDYYVTLYGKLPYPIRKYLSLTHGCGYVVIMSPHSDNSWKMIAEIKTQSSYHINYHRPENIIPIQNGYPVITPEYAIIRYDVFDHHSLIDSSYDPYYSRSGGDSVPLAIYQTFESLVIPPSMKLAIDRTNQVYSSFEYNYVTSSQGEKFLAHHFEPRVVQAYRDLYPGSFKADLWRACQLYITGGLYLDVKLYPLHSLQPILATHNLLLVLDRPPQMIWNGIMGCTPRHPYMKILIDMIVDMVQQRSYGKPFPDALNITGPGTCYRALSQYLSGSVPSTPGSHQDCYLLQHVDGNMSKMSDHNTDYFLYRHPIDPVSNDECYRASGRLYYAHAHQQHRVYTHENP